MFITDKYKNNPEALLLLSKQYCTLLTKHFKEYNDCLVKEYAARMNGQKANGNQLTQLRINIHKTMQDIEEIAQAYAVAY